MTNTNNRAHVLAKSLLTKEQKDNLIYKVSHLALSSYCKGLFSYLEGMSPIIEEREIDMLSARINSMKRVLKFVLEDIQESERELNTG